MKRTKPLRSKTGLRSKGKRGKRLQEWRGGNMAALHSTGGLGATCVACDKPGYLQAAHLFGRGNIIREPLASHPACLALICRQCHRTIDLYQDKNLRRRLEWVAIRKLSESLDIDLPCPLGSPEWDPVDVARWIEREVDDDQVYASLIPEDDDFDDD